MYPTLEEVRQLCKEDGFRRVPVMRELYADGFTTIEAMRALRHASNHVLLPMRHKSCTVSHRLSASIRAARSFADSAPQPRWVVTIRSPPTMRHSLAVCASSPAAKTARSWPSATPSIPPTVSSSIPNPSSPPQAPSSPRTSWKSYGPFPNQTMPRHAMQQQPSNADDLSRAQFSRSELSPCTAAGVAGRTISSRPRATFVRGAPTVCPARSFREASCLSTGQTVGAPPRRKKGSDTHD